MKVLRQVFTRFHLILVSEIWEQLFLTYRISFTPAASFSSTFQAVLASPQLNSCYLYFPMVFHC